MTVRKDILFFFFCDRGLCPEGECPAGCNLNIDLEICLVLRLLHCMCDIQKGLEKSARKDIKIFLSLRGSAFCDRGLCPEGECPAGCNLNIVLEFCLVLRLYPCRA
jgi:hypothetical protein